jgi:hypothetical protein
MTDYPPPPPGNYPPPPPGDYPPPPPPGAYPPPPGGPSGGYQNKTNTLAIVSLVAACIGLFCGIGSIVGIVLGFIARKQIRQTGENGDGIALAGIIVGGISLLLNIVFGVIWASSMSSMY